MIFSSVKNIKIPEGNIISISKNNKVLWRKGKYKKRLAYLESDGNQYLDTEIIGKSGVKTFLDFEFISGDLTDYIPFGSASGNWSTRFYPVSTKDGVWVLGYGARISATSAPVLGQRYAVESELSAGKQTMIVDGSTVISSTGATTVNTNLNMFLFGANNGGALKSYGGSRVYSNWIEVNGVLVRDLIPVLDWNDVPCMFDNVSEEFLYNKGTGQFSYGLL